MFAVVCFSACTLLTGVKWWLPMAWICVSLTTNDAVPSSWVYQPLIRLLLWKVYSDLLFSFNWVVCLFIVEKQDWFAYPEKRCFPGLFWQGFPLIGDPHSHFSRMPFLKPRSFQWTLIIFFVCDLMKSVLSQRSFVTSALALTSKHVSSQCLYKVWSRNSVDLLSEE